MNTTLQKRLVTCVCIAWVGAIGFAAVHASPQSAATPQASARSLVAPASPSRDLVSKYCVSCHNQKLKTANLTLDVIDKVNIANSAEAWEKVIVKLQPCDAACRPAASGQCDLRCGRWFFGIEIDRAAAAQMNPGRSASLHRLNRTEYANAVRDLLAVEVDATRCCRRMSRRSASRTTRKRFRWSRRCLIVT